MPDIRAFCCMYEGAEDLSYYAHYLLYKFRIPCFTDRFINASGRYGFCDVKSLKCPLAKMDANN